MLERVDDVGWVGRMPGCKRDVGVAVQVAEGPDGDVEEEGWEGGLGGEEGGEVEAGRWVVSSVVVLVVGSPARGRHGGW